MSAALSLKSSGGNEKVRFVLHNALNRLPATKIKKKKKVYHLAG